MIFSPIKKLRLTLKGTSPSMLSGITVICILPVWYMKATRGWSDEILHLREDCSIRGPGQMLPSRYNWALALLAHVSRVAVTSHNSGWARNHKVVLGSSSQRTQSQSQARGREAEFTLVKSKKTSRTGMQEKRFFAYKSAKCRPTCAGCLPTTHNPSSVPVYSYSLYSSTVGSSILFICWRMRKRRWTATIDIAPCTMNPTHHQLLVAHT